MGEGRPSRCLSSTRIFFMLTIVVSREMVSLIPRLSSFAVSGTPAKSQVSDLIHVMKYARLILFDSMDLHICVQLPPSTAVHRQPATLESLVEAGVHARIPGVVR